MQNLLELIGKRSDRKLHAPRLQFLVVLPPPDFHVQDLSCPWNDACWWTLLTETTRVRGHDYLGEGRNRSVSPNSRLETRREYSLEEPLPRIIYHWSHKSPSMQSIRQRNISPSIRNRKLHAPRLQVSVVLPPIDLGLGLKCLDFEI